MQYMYSSWVVHAVACELPSTENVATFDPLLCAFVHATHTNRGKYRSRLKSKP